MIQGLLRALRDDAAEVRAAAASALADLGGAEALPELLLAVEDDDALVRQMAIAALGEIGDPRATERLRRALGDVRAEVRFQAVMAFPRVCTSREDAHEALLAATRDDDPLVCHIALRMAEELGEGGGVDERICAPRPGARHARRARGPRGERGPPRSRSGDASAGASRRSWSTSRWGRSRTREREDLAAAIELAGELGIGAARPGLERRAFGGLLGLRRDPFAWHARVALARMGHERACREILGELGASDRDLRTLAVAAAGRARMVAARDRIAAMRGRRRARRPPGGGRGARGRASAALAHAPPITRCSGRARTASPRAIWSRPRTSSGASRLRAGPDLRLAAAVGALAAGVWVGGMVALGACAAPFVFRMTPAPYSGDAMGAAFARFDQIALGAAVALLGGGGRAHLRFGRAGEAPGGAHPPRARRAHGRVRGVRGGSP